MRGLRTKLNLLNDSDIGIGNIKEIRIMTENIVKKNENKKNGSFVKKPATNKNDNKVVNRNNKPQNGKNSARPAKKNPVVKEPKIELGTFEYKMGKIMADEITASTKGKVDAQEVLCEYVNSQLGLKGRCTRVIVELEQTAI